MCNLYRITTAASEFARIFDADVGSVGNAGGDIYPGQTGLVIVNGNLRSMVWGFPLPQTGAKGQPIKPRPVNNARSDKLGSPMWAASFRERRCIIPMDAFAEAEGQRGSKTRT